jgi:RNA polymerase sigma-70 factor (ECF subfamily)
MAEPSDQTLQIQGWIDRLRGGDESARQELLNCACERLTRLTHKMLKGYPRVRRWEETGDVLQKAMMRLYRALENVQPASVVDFFRLAALNIRRELLDLVKHYYGPQGAGAHHATIGPKAGGEDGPPSPLDQAQADDSPNRLAFWTEFHQEVDRLPDEDREVFDLLWYQGLSQAEAAKALGISERTIKRRWQSARLRLYQSLRTAPPDE